MSKVKNEPNIKNPLVTAIREQLEQRAAWLYLLCDEARKKALTLWSMHLQPLADAGSARGNT